MKKASRQQQGKIKSAKASGGAALPGRINPLRTRFWFLTIFTVAFALRLVYLFQINTIPLFEHLAGEARTYYEWGQRIAAGDSPEALSSLVRELKAATRRNH